MPNVQPIRKDQDNRNREPQLRKLNAAAFRTRDVLLEQVYRPVTRWIRFEIFRRGGGLMLPVEHYEDRQVGLDYWPLDDDLVHKRYLKLPEGSVPYGTTAQLLADLRAHFERYVAFPSDMRLLIPHYVLYTWLYDRFPTAPILRFVGDWGNGKSRALQVTGDVCYHAFIAPGGASMASIFRSLDLIGLATLVMDELDFTLQRDEHHDMMRLLRSGFQKEGGGVLRAEDTGSGYKTKAFDVFGPKILAGRKPLPDPALESRCFRVYMSPDVDLSRIPSELPDSYQKEAATLRNKLLRWRYDNYSKPTREPERLAVEPRLFQNYRPLAAVTDDPEALSQLQACVLKLNEEMREERSKSLEAQVAQAMSRLWAQGEKRPLVAKIASDVSSPPYVEVSSTEVGTICRGFDMEPKRESKGMFVPIDLRKLERILERYSLPCPTENGDKM
jgi:hypothetical protein